MPDSNKVAEHYAHPGLIEAIRNGINELGKTMDTVGVDDLAPVDEFHIGGRRATEDFMAQLGLGSDDVVLDVGCGLGGASRFVADRYGCRVTGVDLTPAYVDTGNEVCSWVGLTDRIHLQVGDVTRLSLPAGAFGRAYMMHVGMNIADKNALAREIFRVLGPDGLFGVYDVMRIADGDLIFPVPWAEDPSSSAVAAPGEYEKALTEAGFTIVSVRDRSDFALEFFARIEAAASSTEGPPPLGIHILMGDTARSKVRNMIKNVERGVIAPVEIIAKKAQ